MSIRVALNHETHYRYDRLVTLLPQVVRLRPAPHCRTPILSYSLRGRAAAALPQLAARPVQQLPGPAGLSQASSELRVEVDLVAEMTAINPFDFFVEEAAEKYPVSLRRDPRPRVDPLPGNESRPARSCRLWPANCAAAMSALSITSSSSTAGCTSRSAT